MPQKNRFKRLVGTGGAFGASRAIERGSERLGANIASRAVKPGFSQLRGLTGMRARQVMGKGIQKGVALRAAGRGIASATRLGGLASLPVQAGIELSLHGKFLKQKAVNADIKVRSNQALAAGVINRRKRMK